MKNNAYIILFCYLLTGCIIKSVPPANIYTLSPEWNDTIAWQTQEKNPLTLKMTVIRASQALSGSDILYTDAQYVQNSYAYSRWNDAPVKLLQILFQNSLEKSNLFKAIVPPRSISKTELLLESTLLELSHHINKNETSNAVIRVRFYLINTTTRTIIATKEFVSKVPTTTKNAKGAVVAFNKAATNIAHDLVNWLAQQVD